MCKPSPACTEARALGGFRTPGGSTVSPLPGPLPPGEREQTGNILYTINQEHGLHVHAPVNCVPTPTPCNRNMVHGSTPCKTASHLRSPPPSVGEGQGEDSPPFVKVCSAVRYPPRRTRVCWSGMSHAARTWHRRPGSNKVPFASMTQATLSRRSATLRSARAWR